MLLTDQDDTSEKLTSSPETHTTEAGRSESCPSAISAAVFQVRRELNIIIRRPFPTNEWADHMSWRQKSFLFQKEKFPEQDNKEKHEHWLLNAANFYLQQ